MLVVYFPFKFDFTEQLILQFITKVGMAEIIFNDRDVFLFEP